MFKIKNTHISSESLAAPFMFPMCLPCTIRLQDLNACQDLNCTQRTIKIPHLKYADCQIPPFFIRLPYRLLVLSRWFWNGHSGSGSHLGPIWRIHTGLVEWIPGLAESTTGYRCAHTTDNFRSETGATARGGGNVDLVVFVSETGCCCWRATTNYEIIPN